MGRCSSTPRISAGNGSRALASLYQRTDRPSVAAGVFVGPRRLQGPYIVRWVMNCTAAAPGFHSVFPDTAGKSGRVLGKADRCWSAAAGVAVSQRFGVHDCPSERLISGRGYFGYPSIDRGPGSAAWTWFVRVVPVGRLGCPGGRSPDPADVGWCGGLAPATAMPDGSGIARDNLVGLVVVRHVVASA